MGKDLKGRELGVGIKQRKDGYYVGRYSNKYGKRVQKVFRKLQECRRWYADSTYQDKHSNLDFPQDMTVDSWFKYWIDYKNRTVRPNTVRVYYERYFKNIKNIIGNKILRDVTSIHCQSIMNKMADEGYCSSTIYQARIALYNMLNYAYQNDIIVKNPCNKTVKYDIGKPSKKKEALTIERQRAFCNIIKGNTYEYQYRFLLQTGLRTGELIGLKWSDVDFEKRTLTVSRSMEFRHKVGEWRIGEPKSKAGNRTIQLTDEAVEILRLQKIKNSNIKVIPLEWSEFIFLCGKGTPVKNSTYDTMLTKLCDRANIPRFSMHILRHTFATRCIEGGMNPKTLQTILGHSKITMTLDRYVTTTYQEMRNEIDKVSNVLNVV